MNVNFDKGSGLVPAIIQDSGTRKVLMLGYMNAAALSQTRDTGLVTFFSRSKQRLWVKGETSGHVLQLVDIKVDCDNDTLLVRAKPKGPTCHTGQATCFGEPDDIGFLYALEQIVNQRAIDTPKESYTARLLEWGLPKVAQKVGEEAVEVVIDALGSNDETFKGEVADLMYHILVLLHAKGVSLRDIEAVLQERHRDSD